MSIYEAQQRRAEEEAAMREAIWSGRAPIQEFYGELSMRLNGFLPAWAAPAPDRNPFVSCAILLWPIGVAEGAGAVGAISLVGDNGKSFGERIRRVEVLGVCSGDNPVGIVLDSGVLMGRYAPVSVGRRRQRFSKSRLRS